jgi:intraflagellar transport protein 140
VRGSEALQLAWHPLLPLLAIGWKDGAISFWNAEEKHLEEDSKTHRSPVSSITWNTTGDRLFTTDENAKLSVWKTDRLMRPIHIVSFDEQPGCRIQLCVLGPSETNPETGAVSTTVFYGVNQNNITVLKWANDLAYSGLVLELSDEAQALIYYPEKDQLLVTTGLCSMHLLAKDDALGTWQTISKMKFATGTGEIATTLQVCWACDHTLASASEKDNVVRMYNFDTEDNYILPIDSSDSVTVSRIVCLSADPRCRLLAAGTISGNITVFRYTPPSKVPFIDD